MQDNKHKAVWDWLKTCPHIGDLFFNASRAEDGNTQLIPSESEVVKYIDGTRQMRYECALTRYMAYSADPNDESNVATLVDFDKVAEWLEEQNETGNLPKFPAGYSVLEATVLPSQSGWMVAQDMTLAKFMVQFQIDYIK